MDYYEVLCHMRSSNDIRFTVKVVGKCASITGSIEEVISFLDSSLKYYGESVIFEVF